MKRAFTLIELLVVVLIIGILASIALPQYRAAVEKAKTAEIMTNVATLKQQIDLYIMERGLPASGKVAYKDFASVDLSGCEWVSDESGDYGCRNDNYTYFAYIDPSGGWIEVSHPDSSYSFVATTYPHGYNTDSPVGGWYQTCATQEEDMGRKICKQYENLGWKYIDAPL